MTHRKLWICVTLAAVLLAAGLIFFFSSQNAEESGELSTSIIEPPLTFFEPDYPTMPQPQKESLLSQVSFVVRKLAHFSVFGLLGVCLMAHLMVVRWGKPAKLSGLIAWGIAALYACSDELHQMAVSGRSPEFRDICIDSAGALCGILLLAAVWRLVERHRNRRAR